MKRYLRWLCVCALIMALCLPTLPAGTEPTLASGGQQERELLSSLGNPTHARNAATGKISYLRGTPSSPLYRARAPQADPVAAARAFLAEYGPLFGARDQAREMVVKRVRQLDRGRRSVRFQQVYEGIPIIAGEMYVQLDREGNVISANGELLPVWTLDVHPSVSADVARGKALRLVAEAHHVPAHRLRASRPQLWIYDPRLIGAPPNTGTSLVWRLEVHGGRLGEINEFVVVDAHTGRVLLHFNQVETAKSRQVCDTNNDPDESYVCTSPARSEGDPPTSVPEVDRAYDFSGGVYDFYYSRFGRDSLDGAGMPIVSTVRYCPSDYECPYANAFWDPYFQQVVYGDGFTADDVVGHELTHAVTQFTSGLIYYGQSGAINESLSDVFGELYDLTNGAGTDTRATRWLQGEDTPIGAVRNMADPPQMGDPDRMSSPYYYTGSWDNGGVHTNSGVNNKAAYLMVDGGSFNGLTVRGLGIDKVAAIYYEVETNFLLSGSDYGDLYVGLQQACLNLVGTRGITPADCGEVKKAVDATEMNLSPGDQMPPTGSIQIAGGAEYTNNAQVTIQINATDRGWGVSSMAIWNAGERSSGWQPYSESVSWTLPAGDGPKTVYASFRDAAGNVSEIVSDTIVLDTTRPVAKAPTVSLPAGSTLGTSKIPVRVAWSATDANGIGSYLVQMSTYDGSAWSAWSTIYRGGNTSTTKNLAPGTYRFRVQATDRAGNESAFASSPITTVAAVQENSSAISYSSGWKRTARTGAYGGYVKYHTQAGATATLRFRGRSVSLVTPKAASLGKAEIRVDGVRAATVDLYASSTQARKVVYTKAWSSSGSHTVTIKVLGTSGRPRVDIDAFVILR